MADNIELRKGAIGQGLFSVDPKKTTKIFVPGHLLIDLHDIEFPNDELRVKKTAQIPDRVRALFETFENTYSWGASGRADCEAYLESVDALPQSVRDVLVHDLVLYGMRASHKALDRIRTRYFRSRLIQFNDREVLMPILGLVNHGVRGCPFNIKDGISIAGVFDDEVLARYGPLDAYGAFEMWGFTVKEPSAFSLPVKIQRGSRMISINRNLSHKTRRGNFNIPEIKSDDNNVTISHVMLGHAQYPRLAKGIFYQLMNDIGEDDAEEIFDQIRRINVQVFLKLMDRTEGLEGALITTLRRMCRLQISAIMHSIGTRAV